MIDSKDEGQRGLLKDVSRRSFLKGAGVTSLGVTLTTATEALLQPVHAEAPPPPEIIGVKGTTANLVVNGKTLPVTIEPRMTLAEVLRDQLHFTGTKIGCDRAACGACTVILDGKTVPACLTLAVDAIERPVETIEGLQQGEKLHPLQEAFIQCDALQCGFCTPGMLMSCKNLLDHTPKPSLEQIQKAVSGNLCRCGSYPHVFKAVQQVSGKKGD